MCQGSMTSPNIKSVTRLQSGWEANVVRRRGHFGHRNGRRDQRLVGTGGISDEIFGYGVEPVEKVPGSCPWGSSAAGEHAIGVGLGLFFHQSLSHVLVYELWISHFQLVIRG